MFFVKSKENPPCPFCGGKLKVRDSRNRTVLDADGERAIYRLRRMVCPDCGRIHLEIPDFIQPFKHYQSSVIQDGLDDQECCYTEGSTIYRWKTSFRQAKDQWEARLIAIWMILNDRQWPLLSSVSLLETMRQDNKHWLANAVRQLINHGNRLHTRFAFCP